MQRREFLHVLAAAAAAGFALDAKEVLAGQDAARLYDLPRFGNVSLLHFTDCHAQLLPVWFREPSVNLGTASATGKAPHLVGEHLLRAFKIRPGTPEAHAFTCLDFEQAARTYGKVGGLSHLATLIRRLRGSRPGALLLDGGDTWQGSATALWTKGQDMVGASRLLGVDIMTGHWEFTLGQARVREIIDRDFAGNIEFLAQNIKTADFGDPVFKPYTLREIQSGQGTIAVAVIGQAYPYTPIANPRYLMPDWTFGIREEEMQRLVDETRAKGAQVVVVLSHNGMDVDLKMAARLSGIDAILGGHTHDGVPAPTLVHNRGGKTLVINSGSNGKFLSVLDLDVNNSVRGGKSGGGIKGYRYKLLPVFADLLPADQEMAAYIGQVRSPYQARLDEQLAVSEGLLYRRGNFNGSWDQLILDALLEVKGADIAFSPGFRWGTTILPGHTITMEQLMDQTAITYPYTTLTEMTGAAIKSLLEDVADNLFNPDPYYQQGGDMMRVGGMTYTCAPNAGMGRRIHDLRLGDSDRAMEADKRYKVAGWAPVAEGATGEPIWDVVASYLRNQGTIKPRKLNLPRLLGVAQNPGMV